MSRSTHQFEIKGVDKSAGAFDSIKGKAAATSAQIRSMVGGAIAAAGAYMGFSAIKGGIDTLGHLSDIAQKTSTNVEELTKATAAMDILGIQNMGVDQLAKAFDYMAKTTGRAGMDGFLQTIEELGNIPDIAKRGQEAMKVFGRSGMEFMPLINAAKDGTGAFQTLIATMPGVSQAAADSGDAVSDAMNITTRNIKSLWLSALSVICRNLDGMFAGGVREAAAKGCAYIEWFVRQAWTRTVWFCTNYLLIWTNVATNWQGILASMAEYFKDIFSACGEFLKGMWNTTWEDWKNGKWFGKGPEMFADAMEKALDKVGDRLAPTLGLDSLIDLDTEGIDRTLEAKLAAAEKLQKAYDEAVKTTKASAMALKGFGDVSKTTRISNDLIMGGSNAATRMQILGPTLQTESKKQTTLLEKIATNTEKTADNTEETAKAEDDVGVID